MKKSNDSTEKLAHIDKWKARISTLSTEELQIRFENEDGKWNKESVLMFYEELKKRGMLEFIHVDTTVQGLEKEIKTETVASSSLNGSSLEENSKFKDKDTSNSSFVTAETSSESMELNANIQTFGDDLEYPKSNLSKENSSILNEYFGITPRRVEFSSMKITWEKDVKTLPTKELLTRCVDEEWCEEYRYICYAELLKRTDVSDTIKSLKSVESKETFELELNIALEIEKNVAEYTLLEVKNKLAEVNDLLVDQTLKAEQKAVLECIKDLCELRLSQCPANEIIEINEEMDEKEEFTCNVNLKRNELKAIMNKLIDILANLKIKAKPIMMENSPSGGVICEVMMVDNFDLEIIETNLERIEAEFYIAELALKAKQVEMVPEYGSFNVRFNIFL